MKLKLAVIDLELPPRAKRLLLGIGLPVVLVLAGSAVAYSSGVTAWTSGQQLKAADLNAAFAAVAVPPGTVVAFAGAAVPDGWLLCDGREVDRMGTYSALFAAIQISSGGGDGVKTFNLPDYRGMFLRGLDPTGNADPDTASRTAAATGGNTRAQVGSVEADEFQAHGHSVENGVNGGYYAGGPFFQTLGDGTHNAGRVQEPVTLSGYDPARFGKETRPKNVAVNYIIKY